MLFPWSSYPDTAPTILDGRYLLLLIMEDVGWLPNIYLANPSLDWMAEPRLLLSCGFLFLIFSDLCLGTSTFAQEVQTPIPNGVSFLWTVPPPFLICTIPPSFPSLLFTRDEWIWRMDPCQGHDIASLVFFIAAWLRHCHWLIDLPFTCQFSSSWFRYYPALRIYYLSITPGLCSLIITLFPDCLLRHLSSLH